MDRESTPLWVWLAIGLLAIGCAGYAIVILTLEMLMS